MRLERRPYFDKRAFFASFDVSGEVTVRVTSTQSLERVAILPERFGIRPKVEGQNALTFSAPKGRRLTADVRNIEGRVRIIEVARKWGGPL